MRRVRVRFNSFGSVAVSAALLLATARTATPADMSRLLAVTPEMFLETCRADIDQARRIAARFRQAGARVDVLNSLDLFDSARALLTDTESRASLGRNVHPEQALREAASQCEEEVELAKADLDLDRQMYEAVARLDASDTDPATRHYIDRTLRDFRRAGVDRDEATRARIRALRAQLVQLGQAFGRNIAGDVRTIVIDVSDLDGLPEDFRRSHPPGSDGTVTLTTNNTDYRPFMTFAKSELVREEFWKLYLQRGHPENLRVLDRMLAARRELARLLGHTSWADFITGDKMIGTRANAAAFIDRVAAAAARRAAEDYSRVLDRKRRVSPAATAVETWDSRYLQEQIKSEQYNSDSQAVRPYFEYGRVQRGVMDVAGRMFGLVFVPSRMPSCGMTTSRRSMSSKAIEYWAGSTSTCIRGKINTSITLRARS